MTKRAVFREKLETYLKAGQVAPEFYRYGFGMRLDSVYECFDVSVGRVEVADKKCQVSVGEAE